MESVIAIVFLVFCFIIMTGLHIFSLPGNWVLIALLAAWRLTNSDMDAGLGFFIVIICIAGLGELFEFLGQTWSVKRYGGSNKANWWSIFGAILGAILCAPIFFGLGAIPGAFAGAWVGAAAAEHSLGRPWGEAMRSAKGAVFGKALGLIVKFSLGIIIFMLAASRILATS